MTEFRWILDSCPNEKRLPQALGSVKPSMVKPTLPGARTWKGSPTRLFSSKYCTVHHFAGSSSGTTVGEFSAKKQQSAKLKLTENPMVVM